MVCSCYSAANFKFSEPEMEEEKERALRAATTELERLFKKEDFSRMKVPPPLKKKKNPQKV